MNRGLPVLEMAGGLNSWCRPEGSRPNRDFSCATPVGLELPANHMTDIFSAEL